MQNEENFALEHGQEARLDDFAVDVRARRRMERSGTCGSLAILCISWVMEPARNGSWPASRW